MNNARGSFSQEYPLEGQRLSYPKRSNTTIWHQSAKMLSPPHVFNFIVFSSTVTISLEWVIKHTLPSYPYAKSTVSFGHPKPVMILQESIISPVKYFSMALACGRAGVARGTVARLSEEDGNTYKYSRNEYLITYCIIFDYDKKSIKGPISSYAKKVMMRRYLPAV